METSASAFDPASEAIVLCGGSMMCLFINVVLWWDTGSDDVRFWVSLLIDGSLIGLFLYGVGLFVALARRSRSKGAARP